MPAVYAVSGNLQLPALAGACEISFPRANSVSLILQTASWGGLAAAVTCSLPAGAGWTLYPPASTQAATAASLFAALLLSGSSSALSAYNFLGTFLLAGRGCAHVAAPVTALALLSASALLILSLPGVTAALAIAGHDLLAGGAAWLSADGCSDPVDFQHLFWFFAHPEV